MKDRALYQPSPISPAEAAAFIRGRRTVDHFEPQVPAAAIITEAIELARWAPNHHLTQPWRFYRLGAQSRAAIIELNTRLVSASKGADSAAAKCERWQAVPGWLAVTCRHSEDPISAREDYAACACAMQNFALYLHSAGIGCKWTSGAVTREPGFLDILGADPALEYSVGLFWYGYPKRQARSQRKPVGDYVFDLS